MNSKDILNVIINNVNLIDSELVEIDLLLTKNKRLLKIFDITSPILIAIAFLLIFISNTIIVNILGCAALLLISISIFLIFKIAKLTKDINKKLVLVDKLQNDSDDLFIELEKLEKKEDAV